MNVPLWFLYPWDGGPSGCSQLSEIRTTAAINTHIQTFTEVFSLVSDLLFLVFNSVFIKQILKL